MLVSRQTCWTIRHMMPHSGLFVYLQLLSHFFIDTVNSTDMSRPKGLTHHLFCVVLTRWRRCWLLSCPHTFGKFIVYVMKLNDFLFFQFMFDWTPQSLTTCAILCRQLGITIKIVSSQTVHECNEQDDKDWCMLTVITWLFTSVSSHREKMICRILLLISLNCVCG